MKKYDKKKHELGFYQANPIPTSEDLEEFYKNTYYQEEKSSYYNKYQSLELEYTIIRAKLSHYIYTLFSGKNNGNMLDIGCGEGFVANYFFNKGFNILATDFSSFGVSNHNKDILPYFIEGDIFNTISKLIKENKKYDFINLSNVLEHVNNPILLLEQIKKLMGGAKPLLKIEVPNDFSNFQNMLIENGFVDEEYFFSPPEHISYFTYSSLENTVKSVGFDIYLKQAAFQTESFITNEHTNYAKDNSVGKSVHISRCLIEKYLLSEGIDKYIKYMEAQAELNYSRNIIMYVTLN